MKSINIYAITIVSILLTVSCQKENGLVTLGAKIVDGNDKVYIENRTPKWNDGDLVWVNGDGTLTISDANGTDAKIRNVNATAPYVAIFPAEYASGTTTNPIVTIPAVQVYEAVENSQKVMTPMVAVSNNNSLFFYNLCSLVKVTVENNTGASLYLKKIIIKADASNLSGSASLTINTNNETVIAGDVTENGLKTATLTFSNCTVSDGTNRDFYIAVAPFSNSNDITITVYTTNNKKFSRTRNIASLTCNTIASARLKVSTLQDYGYFTVDGNEKKVLFSPGNLQYKSSDRNDNGIFRFAEHQYDYVGNATDGYGNVYVNGEKCNNLIYSYSSSFHTNNKWIDLFGWGTSGFSIKGCFAGSTNNQYGPNGYINGTDYDWGVYNNSLGSGWRTMTKDEWGYLFESRNSPTINNVVAKYLQVKITGVTVGTQDINVRGIVIFPDDYEWPEDIPLPTTLNTLYPFNNSTNLQQYSLQQWGKLEDAGAVLLPSCGYRDGLGSTINNQLKEPDNLYYWSSTNSVCDKAYCLGVFFNTTPKTFNTRYSQYRKFGCSVRLVKDVQ